MRGTLWKLVGTAGAVTSAIDTFAALKNAKEAKLRKAIQDLGYNQYLEKYAVVARTISEAEAWSLITGSNLVMKVKF